MSKKFVLVWEIIVSLLVIIFFHEFEGLLPFLVGMWGSALVVVIILQKRGVYS